MRKITLLLCAVVAAAGVFTANAGAKSLTATSKKMARQSETVCTQIDRSKARVNVKGEVAPVKKTRATTKALSSIQDVCGIYRMTGSTLLNNVFYDSYPEITLNEAGDGILISNFTAYASNSFEATVDLASGRITIAPGQVAFYSTYYSADIYLGTYTNGAFDTTTPLVGVVNDDGTITFEQWVMIGFVQGFFQAAQDVVMEPLNGEMEIVTLKEAEDSSSDNPEYEEVTETIPVMIKQTMPSQVTVYHFAGYDDYPVAINVNKAQEVTIPKTVIYDYSSDGNTYYDVYTIGFNDTTGEVNPDSVIIGTGTPEELTWGAWNTELEMNGTNYNFYNNWYTAGMKLSGRLYYTNGQEFSFPTVEKLQGDGTEDNPFTISNVEELLFFKNEVNFNGKTYAEQFIEVIDNIDMTGVEFEPIGSSTTRFAGNFNGGNHIIKGITIASSGNDVGFFSYNTGVVRNLTLTDVDIQGNNNVGAIVGNNYATSANADKVIVENCSAACSSTGYVWGNQKVGGIVGTSTGTVRGCEALEDAFIVGVSSVGGIVGGQTRGSIENSDNASSMIAYNPAKSETNGFGGIVGTAGSTAKVSNCVNSGIINGYRYSNSPTVFGGIVGAANNITVSGCDNYGTVYGDSIVGGIVGRCQTLTMENCLSEGDVLGVVLTQGSDAIVGGLIGKSVSSTVTASKATGDVQAGYYNGSSLSLSGGVVGGLVGQANANANTKVTNCYSSAKPLANGIAGGIVGRGGGVYTNVYNIGEVSAPVSGGFVGQAQTGFTVDGGYNMGPATAALVGSVADGVTPSVDALYVTDFGSEDTYGTPITLKDLAAYNPAEAISNRQLRAMNDSQAWNYNDEYTLPTLRDMQDDEAIANAAALILTGDDTYDNVTDVMHVGLPDGAVWSVSDESVLGFDATDPSQINILKASTDQVTVTVTVGDFTKSWTITLNASVPSAIETLSLDNKDVKSVRYFNAAGVESKEPFNGINIVVKTMTDGSVQVVKVVK